MSQKKITIPADNAALRNLIRNTEPKELKKRDKNYLQQLYTRAKEVYEGEGSKISRKEREVLFSLQEALFGGLDTKLKSSLENIGETLAKKPDKRKKAIDYSLPSTGAVIVKNWKNKKLEVKILKKGFEYEGRMYKSLSCLAREISGYAVSGPVFFGLRKAKVKSAA